MSTIARIDAAALRAHGSLDGEETRALVRRGLAEIVDPCRRALFEGGAPALDLVALGARGA